MPFCARRCSYCDFAIAVRAVTPDASFVRCVAREWRARCDMVPADAAIATIYFGGGTPSRLDPSSIAQLIDAFAADRHVAPDVEITLEANPDDVTPARAAGWAAAGVNRVSLGVQSHDPAVLRWMHRTHQAEQVAPAITRLRDAGIGNVSVDLIFALPDALHRDWARDVDLTLALAPSHVSLYGLTIEPHTPLARWRDRDATLTAPDDRYAEEYQYVHRALVEHGFEHYEVSNAARPERRSRHNSGYWSGADYLGLGPSAHSLIGGIRQWNIREWAAYQRAADAGEPVEAGREGLDAAAQAMERRYLRLRTRTGLPLDEVGAATVRRWCDAGWATRASDSVRLTVEGWLRLDALVIDAGKS